MPSFLCGSVITRPPDGNKESTPGLIYHEMAGFAQMSPPQCQQTGMRSALFVGQNALQLDTSYRQQGYNVIEPF